MPKYQQRILRARSIVVAGTCVLLAASACSLLTSYDGLEGPNGDASPGGPDAASGPSWCETHAADASFCEDFDRFGLSRFDPIKRENGTVTLDQAAASSPPYAMLARGDGPAKLSLGAYHASNTTASSATLSADVRIEKANQAGFQSAQLLQLFFNPGTTTKFEVGVGVGGTGSGTPDHARFVYRNAAAIPNAQPFAIVSSGASWPLQQWVRVTLHVMFAPDGGGTADVDFDGVAFAKGVPLTQTPALGSVAFNVGVGFADQGHDGWAVRIDNVVFDPK